MSSSNENWSTNYYWPNGGVDNNNNLNSSNIKSFEVNWSLSTGDYEFSSSTGRYERMSDDDKCVMLLIRWDQDLCDKNHYFVVAPRPDSYVDYQHTIGGGQNVLFFPISNYLNKADNPSSQTLYLRRIHSEPLGGLRYKRTLVGVATIPIKDQWTDSFTDMCK